MKHPNIFSFCNQKGGVGKTTSAINIATSISNLGYKVLLIDIDPQGNATSGLGEEKKADLTNIYDVLSERLSIYESIRNTKIENLNLIASSVDLSASEIELISVEAREFRLKKALDPIKDRFDYIFIDCPPSLGLLTINALVASDFILIPLQCEYYALEGLGQLIQTYYLVKKNLNENLKIGSVIMTMADFRTKLTEQVIAEVRTHFSNKVFDTIIPRSIRLSEAPSFGQPGILYDKSSKGAKSYLAVSNEFLKRFPPSSKTSGNKVDTKESSESLLNKEMGS